MSSLNGKVHAKCGFVCKGSDPLLRGVERLRTGSGNVGTNLAVTRESLCEAAERIAPWTHRTPCWSNETLQKLIFGQKEKEEEDQTLLFKCENFQRTGAFKFRGASNAVLHEIEQNPSKEGRLFVTESSGNHGQAIALAAKLQDAKAIIVVPKNAPSAKKDAMQEYGAEIRLVEPEERAEVSSRVVKENNATFVHPSNDPFVMSGQGTAMLELYEQALDLNIKLDTIITPVGGGGLLSGTAVAAKLLHPDMIVIGAEPELADDAYRSKQSGKIQGHRDGKVPTTIADGLRTTLGSNTFPIVHELVDSIELVSELEIKHAMQLVFERCKLVIETNSAVAVAAALKLGSQRLLKGNVGIIISGGNVTTEKMFHFDQ